MLNMNKKLHWAKKREIVAAWRQAACVYGRQSRWKDIGPTVVRVTFHVGANRRRDPHNWAPTIKPIVDGFTDAGFWPDDNVAWVAIVDPVFVVDKNRVGEVFVELLPMGTVNV
jgi:crossover junction endodeoxyribonuclease RusA